MNADAKDVLVGLLRQHCVNDLSDLTLLHIILEDMVPMLLAEARAARDTGEITMRMVQDQAIRNLFN